MSGSILYSNARIRAGEHFSIPQQKGYFKRREGLHISSAAAKQLGEFGGIAELDYNQVKLLEAEKDIPAVFIRQSAEIISLYLRRVKPFFQGREPQTDKDNRGRKIIIGSQKLYLTAEELAQMSAFYETTEDVLRFAFFETAKGTSTSHDVIKIRPHAAELLQPAYRDLIWDWAAGKAYLPEPLVISPYPIRPSGELVIPGFLNIYRHSITNLDQGREGTITFDTKDGKPNAFFQHRQLLRRYILSGDIRNPQIGINLADYHGKTFVITG
jgi:hypothetical protein